MTMIRKTLLAVGLAVVAMLWVWPIGPVSAQTPTPTPEIPTLCPDGQQFLYLTSPFSASSNHPVSNGEASVFSPPEGLWVGNESAGVFGYVQGSFPTPTTVSGAVLVGHLTVEIQVEIADGDGNIISSTPSETGTHNGHPYFQFDFDPVEVSALRFRVARVGFDFPHVRFAHACVPIEEEPTEGQILCPLVENANFSAVEGWNLVGISEISGGVLTMAGTGSAAQNVTVEPLVTYNSVISVTYVTSTTIGVALGSQGQTLNISSTGTYTSTFTTPGVIGGPLEYLLENQSANAIQINFACLQLADGSGERVCIAPDNGEFATAAGWTYQDGATHNSQLQNVLLPYQDRGQIRSTATYSMPQIAAGEYLIFSWDSQSADGQGGLIGGALSDTSVNEWYEAFANTYDEWYTYEFDVSSFAEQAVEVRFLAPGVDPVTDTALPGDVYLDNVCLFVSDQPAQLPYPADPNAPPTVDLGDFYSCADVDGVLFGLVGVDLRYHRAVYAETPGFLDFSDWVPWIVAAFWVGVSVYLCVFFVLIQTVINFAAFLLNNWLNIFTWVLSSSTNFIAWLGLWLANNFQTAVNAVEVSLTTAGDWLTWLGLILLAFSLVPGSFFGLLFVGLLWLFGGFTYMGDFLSNFFPWLFSQSVNTQNGLFNRFVAFWNLFLAALGPALSAILEGIVSIWNNGAGPFLLSLLGILNPILGLLALAIRIIAAFPVIWGFIWATVMWLWENVWQVINLPLTFYTGMQAGINSNAFGSLLDCSGPGSFWCAFLAGLDLLNSIAGASIFYPIVIVAVIVGTFMVFRKHGGAGWEVIVKSIENL